MSDSRNPKPLNCIVCKGKISFYNKNGVCKSCIQKKNYKPVNRTNCKSCGDKIGSANNTGLCKNCYVEWNKREQFKIYSQQESSLDALDFKLDKDIDKKIKAYLEREKFQGKSVLKNVGYWGSEDIKNRKFYNEV